MLNHHSEYQTPGFLARRRTAIPNGKCRFSSVTKLVLPGSPAAGSEPACFNELHSRPGRRQQCRNLTLRCSLSLSEALVSGTSRWMRARLTEFFIDFLDDVAMQIDAG